MSKKLIIIAALSGVATTKEMAPTVPITADEIAAEVVAVAKAGASIVHIHVRDDQGGPTMDSEKFKEAFYATKKALAAEGLDMVINLTTSGANGGTAPDEVRMAHLRELKPEMCSFDAGTMNWQCSIIFENPPGFLEKLCKCTLEENIKPELEIFDAGMMGNADYYMKQGLLKTPCHYQFVLGVLGGLEGTVGNLSFLVSKLPPDSTWSITGLGKAHMPMMLAGLAMGCDCLRVGLEDNIYYSKGVKATNTQLVERAVKLGKLVGRSIASPQEAREILGLCKRQA
jgi:uncharacterized protein (DUF849 family)